MFLVLGLGLEHSCPWPQEGRPRKGCPWPRIFFVSLALASKPRVLDSTSTLSLSSSTSVFNHNNLCLLESLPFSKVESRTQGSRPRPRTQKKSEAKAKDTKKIRGQTKDSLSEDRTSRGQEQECSRPRTKDTGASNLQKKKIFKNFFQAISNSLAYSRIFDWGRLKPQLHEMTASKFFQRGSFCGTNIS